MEGDDIENKQRLYGLIGHLIRNIKVDKNFKNPLLSVDNNIDKNVEYEEYVK